MHTTKRWSICLLVLTLTILGLLAGITIYIDPYFHYHGFQQGLQYPLSSQRYITDGILRNFQYDAIITGSSMSENYKTSEFDALFGTNSVKVPLSGSYLRETAERLDRALSTHPHTRYVVRSIDMWALTADKDHLSDFDYPDYLYDDNPFNDVQYILNKSVLVEDSLKVLEHTRKGKVTTSFDDYSNWSSYFTYGAQEVLKRYSRVEKTAAEVDAAPEQIQRAVDNIRQNVIDLAQKYPDTEFYCYIPPWSIFLFDSWNQNGVLKMQLSILEAAVEQMVACENIHVFSFLDDYDTVCNTDNHKDVEHYGEWVNSHILQCMKSGEHLLDESSFREHFRQVRAFYEAYDYDSLFPAEP